MRRCYPVLASPSGSRGGDRPTVGTQERAPLASRILNEALLRHRLEEKKIGITTRLFYLYSYKS